MVEEVHVPRERVLIHRLNVAQFADVEEEMRDVHRDGAVPETSLIDLLLRLLGDGLLDVDLVGQLLGAGNDLNRRLRLEDGTLGRTQHLDDLILHLLELSRVLGALQHQPHLLLLQIGSLPGHRDAQELVRQSVDGDHHVEQSYLHRRLGQVVRIAQLRRDVESEVLVVLHRRVAEAETHLPALLEHGLEQQRLERGVELLSNVLEQHWRAELNGVLELAHEIAVRELHHHEVMRLLHSANPLVRLSLRVDDERPPATLAHHDGVVDAEGIVR